MESISNIRRLSSVFAIKQERTVFFDNLLFKMHYKFAVALLMASAFILTGKSCFGKPITCLVSDGITKEGMEHYCYVSGGKTYHPNHDTIRLIPEEAYPGVGPIYLNHSDYSTIYHDIYKWTPFIFILMAASCYFPHLIWKITERGRLKILVQHMDSRKLTTSDDASMQENKAAKWFIASKGTTTFYMVTFVACELLNVLNCAVQMYIIHYLFDYEMLTKGIELLLNLLNNENQLPLLHRTFPTAVKCDMPKYGPSGTVEMLDAICFLHQNYFTRLAYVTLWCWFFFAGTCSLLYIAIFRTRFLLKQQRFNILHNQCPIADINDIQVITNTLSTSDMFVLVHLCGIIQPYHIEPLLKEISSRITREDNSKETNSIPNDN